MTAESTSVIETGAHGTCGSVMHPVHAPATVNVLSSTTGAVATVAFFPQPAAAIAVTIAMNPHTNRMFALLIAWTPWMLCPP